MRPVLATCAFLILAFLGCVLVVVAGEARTALAQQTSPQQAPQQNLSPDKERNAPGPLSNLPEVTATCSSAVPYYGDPNNLRYPIIVTGSNFTPGGGRVDVSISPGDLFISLSGTDQNGSFEVNTYPPSVSIQYGRSYTIEVVQEGTGRSAKTTVQCPEPPAGATTTQGGGGTTSTNKGGSTTPGTTTSGGSTTTTQGGGAGGSGSSSSSSGSILSMSTIGSVFSGLFAGQLPDTGGGWTILLIAGAILIALGWLLVRLARRLASAR